MGDYGEGHTVESMDLISMEGKGTKKKKKVKRKKERNLSPNQFQVEQPQNK